MTRIPPPGPPARPILWLFPYTFICTCAAPLLSDITTAAVCWDMSVCAYMCHLNHVSSDSIYAWPLGAGSHIYTGGSSHIYTGGSTTLSRIYSNRYAHACIYVYRQLSTDSTAVFYEWVMSRSCMSHVSYHMSCMSHVSYHMSCMSHVSYHMSCMIYTDDTWYVYTQMLHSTVSTAAVCRDMYVFYEWVMSPM
jgi:hypothetical protein